VSLKKRNIYLCNAGAIRKPREEVLISDMLRYVTSKADTFIMFKGLLELNKKKMQSK
jgi:hypothetical protein